MSLTQNAADFNDIEELDWTQLLDAYDYARPQRGELREGVIPQQDLRQMGDEYLSGLKVGAPIQVYIQDPENREGDLVL